MEGLMVQEWCGRWLVGRHPLGPSVSGSLAWGIRVNDVVADCPTKEAALAALAFLSSGKTENIAR
jgi:hypothetical protein